MNRLRGIELYSPDEVLMNLKSPGENFAERLAMVNARDKDAFEIALNLLAFVCRSTNASGLMNWLEEILNSSFCHESLLQYLIDQMSNKFVVNIGALAIYQ